MALPCVLRGVCRKVLDGHLKSNAAILGSLRPFNTFGQRGNYLDQQNQLLGQGLHQRSARGQLLSNVCLQNVKNCSLIQKRSAGLVHDHGKLWGAERILSISLLATVPAALIFPSQALDTIVAVSMVLHSHWGLEACVIDYIRPIIFGPVLPKVSLGLLYLISISSLAGLFYLIYNDMGLANAVLKLWKL